MSAQHTPGAISERGFRDDMCGWLRCLTFVERYRSRWAIVERRYYTRERQWGGMRFAAGDYCTGGIVESGFASRRAAIAKATGSAA